jgi:carboxypeptidase C (cathepsin A)
VRLRSSLPLAALCVALAIYSAPVGAASPRASAAAPHAPAAAAEFPDAVTQHTMTLDGRAIPYTARAGTITLYNDENQPTCSMFYVAYTEDGANPRTRPVTFLYNGGPGSASMWLHMGSFGPVRVVSGNGTMTGPPPYTLEPNPYSLLDKSDLVFVDMPNTGFGRIIGAGTPKDFFGVDQDAQAFAQFIERYITKFGRWNSPKVLYGESYGTTRSAAVGLVLQRAGVVLNGIVLQSSILNFNLDWNSNYTSTAVGGSDSIYVLYLPTEAATAWYHNRVPHHGTLQSFLQGVQHFAMTEYLEGLAQGDMLGPAARDDIVLKLHEYTGLSEAYIRETNLRIDPDRFGQLLLQNDREIIGELDSRYVNYTLDATAEEQSVDPLESAIFGPYTTAINQYLRETLRYNPPIPYKSFTEVPGGWDWNHDHWPVTNVAVDLAQTMVMNPILKVFSSNGYFDFATPYLATIYTLHHLNLPPNLERNITFGFYQVGHMIYLNPPVFAQYRRDLEHWYSTL